MKMFKGNIEWKDSYVLEVYQSRFIVYDTNGNTVYYENSRGDWYKCEFGENGDLTYYENNSEHWAKWEYDESGNEVYYEDSDGKVSDNRKKEVTLKLTEEQIKQVKEWLDD